MHALVEQHVRLIVHAMHDIEHDVVEGQERRSAQLLSVVLVGVLAQAAGAGAIVHAEQVEVELLERGGPAKFRAEFLRARGRRTAARVRVGQAVAGRAVARTSPQHGHCMCQ